MRMLPAMIRRVERMCLRQSSSLSGFGIWLNGLSLSHTHTHALSLIHTHTHSLSLVAGAQGLVLGFRV